jgi:hypothetical protein
MHLPNVGPDSHAFACCNQRDLWNNASINAYIIFDLRNMSQKTIVKTSSFSFKICIIVN